MPGAYYGFIKVKVGNNDIHLSESENIMQLNVKYKAKDIIEFVLEVYDDMAHIIEDEIITSGSKNLSLQYGYSRGDASNEFDCFITKFDIEFVGLGEILTIEGVSSTIGSNMYYTEKDSKGNEVAVPKTYTGTVSSIFRDLCSQVGWTPRIVVETKKMSTDNYSEEFSLYRDSTTSTIDFIETLKLNAVSVEGESDYIFELEYKDGTYYADFMPSSRVKDRNSDILTFQVGTDNEEIISFRPSIGGLLYALSGSENVVTPGMDSRTSDEYTNTMITQGSSSVDLGTVTIYDAEVPKSGLNSGNVPEPISSGPNAGKYRDTVSIEFRSKSTALSMLGRGTLQRAAMESNRLQTDRNGIGYFMVNGVKRYAVALTSTFGGDMVGTLVNLKMNDGVVIPVIKCDQKRTNNISEGSDAWGHMYGRCVTELFLSIDDNHGYEFMGSKHTSYPVSFEVVGKVDKAFFGG